MGTVSHLCVASCELHDHLWLKMPFHIYYIYIAFPQCVLVDALLDDYAVKKPYHIDYIYITFPQCVPRMCVWIIMFNIIQCVFA